MRRNSRCSNFWLRVQILTRMVFLLCLFCICIHPSQHWSHVEAYKFEKLDSIQSQNFKGKTSSFFVHKGSSFTIEEKITIVFVGIELETFLDWSSRSEKLHPNKRLKAILSKILPKFSPASTRGRIEFLLDYAVTEIDVESQKKAHQEQTTKAAKLLNTIHYEVFNAHREATSAADVSRQCLGELICLSVQDSKIEKQIDELAELIGHKSNVIMFLNPDIIAEKQQVDKMNYCYSYTRGRPVPYTCTQTWTTKSGTLVVDVSAGPLAVGNLFNSIHKSISVHDRNFIGEVVDLIVSAVELVFVPDLAWEELIMSSRTIVPVVVFQSSEESQNECSKIVIDKDYITGEVKKIFAAQRDRFSVDSEEQIVVLFHNVKYSEHKAVATVIAGARRSDSYVVSDTVDHSFERDLPTFGYYKIESREFLESNWILDRIVSACSEVLSDMIQNRFGALEANEILSFLNEYSWVDQDSDMYTYNSDPNGGGYAPIHVVPVIVVSAPDGLSFDFDGKLVATSNRVAVVMHTCRDTKKGSLSNIENPNEYFVANQEHGKPFVLCQSYCVFVDLTFDAAYVKATSGTDDTSRRIVAGVAVALSGIIPPYGDESIDKKRTNLRFAFGSHPFGPFVSSEDSFLNEHMLRLMKRNAIISRLDFCIRIARSAIEAAEQFAQENIYDPYLMQKIYFSDYGTEWSWLDVLLNHPKSFDHIPDFVAITMKKVYSDTVKMSKYLEQIHNDLMRNKLDLAEHIAMEALNEALQFKRSVINGLLKVEKHVACCRQNLGKKFN